MSLNVVVVRGACSAPAEVRVLPSGNRLVTLQVTCRGPEVPTTSLPVAAVEPPPWVESLDTGDEVLVTGRVRRRFFRAGGATASRVEVEADTVVRARDTRRVRAALRRVEAVLTPFDG